MLIGHTILRSAENDELYEMDLLHFSTQDLKVCRAQEMVVEELANIRFSG